MHHIKSGISGGTPDFSFAWSTGDITQTVSGLPASSYSLTITDANGCQGFFDFTIELGVGVKKTLDSRFVSVFPNPVATNDQLAGNGKQFGWPSLCRIGGCMGRKVFSKKIRESTQQGFKMPEAQGTFYFILKNERGDKTVVFPVLLI